MFVCLTGQLAGANSVKHVPCSIRLILWVGMRDCPCAAWLGLWGRKVGRSALCMRHDPASVGLEAHMSAPFLGRVFGHEYVPTSGACVHVA